MKRAFLSSFLAAILLSFSVLTGMMAFGMSLQMGMHSGSCMGSGCALASAMEAHGTDCLDHCLGVASSVSTFVVPLSLALLLFVAIGVLIASAWPIVVSFLNFAFDRSREGIGKMLLRQKLSPVILRN